MVNLPITYSSKKVTPFGGMSLMKRFVDQTGIREQLSDLDLPQPASNAGYEPSQIVESFWLSIWTGASRYIHCDWCDMIQHFKRYLDGIVCPHKVHIAVFLVSFHKNGIQKYFQIYRKDIKHTSSWSHDNTLLKTCSDDK